MVAKADWLATIQWADELGPVLATKFGRLFHRVAGRRETVDREMNRRTKGAFDPGAAELFG